MKVKRTSWFSRISNLGYDWKRTNDNLCNYFWRAIGKGFGILLGTALSVCLLYSYFTHNEVISTTIMILFMIFSVGIPVLVIYFVRKNFGKSPEMPYGNIVIEYIKAKKNKICPLIEYVD